MQVNAGRQDFMTMDAWIFSRRPLSIVLKPGVNWP